MFQKLKKLSSLKLTAGKLIAAWEEYPNTRKSLAQMKSGSPILVTGVPRSGTTWVGSMLSVSGMWYVHEPFKPSRGLWDETFTYLSVNEQSDRDSTINSIDKIIKKILSGKYRYIAKNKWCDNWLMPLRLFPQPIHRLLIKDPIACLLSEYLTNKYQMQTIVLFRHPCGFVSSILRLGWPFCSLFQQFLDCETLMQDWLLQYRNLIESVKSTEDIESAAILHGCLNTVLWGFCQRNKNMSSFIYEELCNSPIETFRQLFNELNLPYNEVVMQIHLDHCFNEEGRENDYHTHEVKRKSRDMAYAWRYNLSIEQINRIKSIWEQFEVPLYRSEDDWCM